MPTDTRSPAEAGPPAAPVPRRGLFGRLFVGVGWLLITVVVLAGLGAALTTFVEPPLPLPERTGVAGAVTLTTVLSGLAALRAGVRIVVATLFAAVVSVSAVLGGWHWLLCGVVALTAFASAVLAVLSTRPARRVMGVVGEYVVALAVAAVGAVGAAAYQAPVRESVLTDLVSLAALGATLWVAYRLGGGLPGLGKRGGAVIGSALGVIVLGILYSEALRRWGSPAVVRAMDGFADTTLDVLGALPPPLEVLVGFPALVWGLATRAQLRQGWWVCAFGALATAGVTTSLADPAGDLVRALLDTAYAAGIGLVLGFLVWRIDLALTGQGRQCRRARRAERARPMRPEPSRTRPLM